MQQQVRVFTELDPMNFLDLIRTRRLQLQEAAADHLGPVDDAMRVQALRSLMVRALDKPDDMDRLKRVLTIIRPDAHLSDDEITELCQTYTADQRARA